MKEVTLSSGRVERIETLSIAQTKRMMELAATNAMEATINACVDSINRAKRAGATPIDAAEFEGAYSIPEANELYLEVATLSGLQVGEMTAPR